jgi:hypothetical protein
MKLASANARPNAVSRRTAGANRSANAHTRAETIATGFYREAQNWPIPELANPEIRRVRAEPGAATGNGANRGDRPALLPRRCSKASCSGPS